MRVLTFLAVFFFTSPLLAQKLSFKTKQVYESPKSNDLGVSVGLAIDGDGCLYHIDEDGVLTLWNKNGKYLKTLGGRGQGPGEFEIKYSIPHMTQQKDAVIVVDQNRFSFFKQQKFSHSVPKFSDYRQVTYFQALDDEQFLIVYRSYRGNASNREIYSHVVVTDQQFVPVHRLVVEREWMYTPNNKGGWLYQPHAPRMIVAQNVENLFLAYSNQASLELLGFNGTKRTRLSTGLKPPQVSETEIENLRMSFEISKGPQDSMKLEKYDAIIDQIIPLQKDIILVCQYKQSNGRHEGVVLNTKTGNQLASLDISLGEQGRIFSLKSSLVLSRVDSNGQVRLSQVVPVFESEHGRGHFSQFSR